MNRKRIASFLALALLLLLLSAGAVVLAQTSAGFNLQWHVMAGGGTESASADYRVTGTIGQNMTGPTANSADYSVNSGYWFTGAGASSSINLPVVFKN